MKSCKHEDKVTYRIFETENIYECLSCKLIFSSKFLENFDPPSLYNDYYRNETPLSTGKFKLPVEYVVRFFRLFRALKIYTLCGSGKEILDVGCGRGWMLYYLKKYFGFKKIVGTQISFPAFKHATKRLSLEVYQKDLLELEFEKNSFDVVTMLHVLEHVKDPVSYLTRIAQLLKPGGLFVVEVPNLSSWTRKLSGKYWLGYDLKYHLSFFSEDILRNFLSESGFTVLTVRTFSLEYSTFISAQSLLSQFTKTDNLFFNFIQGKQIKMPIVVMHGLLLTLFLPVCFAMNILLYFSKRGEVLLMLARKEI